MSLNVVATNGCWQQVARSPSSQAVSSQLPQRHAAVFASMQSAQRERHSVSVFPFHLIKPMLAASNAFWQQAAESAQGQAVGLQPPQRQASMLASMLAPQQDRHSPSIDPFQLVKPELGALSSRIREAVASEIPALQQAASYFFQGGKEGKRIRSTLCLLVSSALSHTAPPHQHLHTADLRPVSAVPLEQRRRQQRVAEIAELIHVASLLHDDVIDDAETRRGKAALNHVLGNKVAILAGDFLLARASMTLATLKNSDVVTLMSQILEDLVSGEVLQATASAQSLTSMDHYLRKTYLKTASLMANACEAAAVVCDSTDSVRIAAHEFGKNLGLAFQVRPSARQAWR